MFRRTRVLTIGFATAVLIVASALIATQPDETPPGELGALGMMARWNERAMPLQKRITDAFAADDLDAAEEACREFTRQLPFSPDGFYNLACVQARRNQTEEALATLSQAVDVGFRNIDHARQDPDLESIRGDARFAALMDKAATSRLGAKTRAPLPAEIENGVARVTDANTMLDPRTGLLRPLVRPAPPLERTEKVTNVQGPAGDLLREWWADGTAAGHQGDFYDNRDRGHSNLKGSLFPGLVRFEYGPEAQTLVIDRGLPERIMHNGVVLGNASLAMTNGFAWRSMPRMAMSNPRSAALLALQYQNNQLYIYPCHVDHGPGHNGGGGHGDVYFANVPYVIISQGSSGTDQPFLEAIALTMAAFQPDVKERLVKQFALAPTLQAIFRSSNRQVERDEDYFTGRAHPPVFQGDQIDAAKMVTTAHEMSLPDLPPVVNLEVVDEESFVSGRDFFDPVENERLFDTPAAIARVMRAGKRERRMVVSAEKTRNLTDGELEWRWVLLQGDEDLVTISPEGDGSRAELVVAWHDRRPVSPGSELQTNRVDIACFARSGGAWSAPAFVTFYCPDNEERVYDDEGRLQSISYNQNYADPLLVVQKKWRDEYHYGDDGSLTGWTRKRGISELEFNAEGRRIVSRGRNGEPDETRAGVYRAVAPGQNQAPVLQYEDLDEMQ